MSVAGGLRARRETGPAGRVWESPDPGAPLSGLVGDPAMIPAVSPRAGQGLLPADGCWGSGRSQTVRPAWMPPPQALQICRLCILLSPKVKPLPWEGFVMLSCLLESEVGSRMTFGLCLQLSILS